MTPAGGRAGAQVPKKWALTRDVHGNIEARIISSAVPRASGLLWRF